MKEKTTNIIDHSKFIYGACSEKKYMTIFTGGTIIFKNILIRQPIKRSNNQEEALPPASEKGIYETIIAHEKDENGENKVIEKKSFHRGHAIGAILGYDDPNGIHYITQKGNLSLQKTQELLLQTLRKKFNNIRADIIIEKHPNSDILKSHTTRIYDDNDKLIVESVLEQTIEGKIKTSITPFHTDIIKDSTFSYQDIPNEGELLKDGFHYVNPEDSYKDTSKQDLDELTKNQHTQSTKNI